MDVRISSIREILSLPGTQIRASAAKEGEVAVRRRSALRRVDRELEKGHHKTAVLLVKQLKAHPGGLLRGFGGAAVKVSKSVPHLDELKLAGKSEISSLQSVVDAALHSIKCSLEFQLKEEENGISQPDSNEMVEDETYRLMCMQHEAGHFLVGYMLGFFPRRYNVPSMEDLQHGKFARGRVEFFGFEFLTEMFFDTRLNKKNPRRRPNDETLKKFLCALLGGLAAEHLVFGYSDLLHSDVSMLDRILKWLDFTEKEFDFKTREAVETAVSILSSQSEAQCRLAEAMGLGRSGTSTCFQSLKQLSESVISKAASQLVRVHKWLDLTEKEVDFKARKAVEAAVSS